jgi:peptide/nickel transport system substrate-binding protein
MRRLAALTLTLLLLVGAGAAIRSERAAAAESPTTLHLDVVSDPHTLNPELSTDAQEEFIGRLMLEPLIDFDGSLLPHPVLATEVPSQANGGISAAGTTVTFHLRHGVKWHDGVDFTSEDVAFTVGLIQDAKNNIPNRDLYANITSVDAPDPFTVRFHLEHRQSAFLSQIGAGYPILPAHILASSANLATDPFNAAPIGTGPYRFVHTGHSVASTRRRFRDGGIVTLQSTARHSRPHSRDEPAQRRQRLRDEPDAADHAR